MPADDDELGEIERDLVKHRSILKNRIHSALIAFGYHSPVSDLFGVAGRQLLQRMDFPEPWKGNVTASLELIDDSNHRIDAIARQLKRAGADHAYVPLLMTAPGIGAINSSPSPQNSATSTASPPGNGQAYVRHQGRRLTEGSGDVRGGAGGCLAGPFTESSSEADPMASSPPARRSGRS